MLNLLNIQELVLTRCKALLDKEGPYGCYRRGDRQRPDLYSSLDIALIRAIMGEDLRVTLPSSERKEWIDHINSFAQYSFNSKSSDGSYGDTYNHSTLHANGMVIGALASLGGKQRHPVRLYDDFNTGAKVTPWLESIDWRNQWPASHLFWGGMLCFSFSKHSNDAWLEEVFRWLNENLDPVSGWWRIGVPHDDRNQPLGGSVHILPIYQHHARPFPYPERVIDSVLSLQFSNRRWLETDDLHVMNYLELDALYALEFMGQLAPGYRSDDVNLAVTRYATLVETYWDSRSQDLLQLHPHRILAAIGTLGLLQRLKPDAFQGDVEWSDIFSNKQFHNTAEVEV